MTHPLDVVRADIQVMVDHMLESHWQYHSLATKVQRALNTPLPCTPETPCRGCAMARERHR